MLEAGTGIEPVSGNTEIRPRLVDLASPAWVLSFEQESDRDGRRLCQLGYPGANPGEGSNLHMTGCVVVSLT